MVNDDFSNLPPATTFNMMLDSALGIGDNTCDYCLKTAAENRQGQHEELLVCKDCMAKAHPSCMDYSEDLAKRAQNSPWQCIDCKTCYVCENLNDPDTMLFCDACDKGYHMQCHNPPLTDKPTGKWVCQKCILELGSSCGILIPESSHVPLPGDQQTESNSSDAVGTSCLPTPSASPVPYDERGTSIERLGTFLNGVQNATANSNWQPSLPLLAETVPSEIPDASNWEIEDVVGFFRSVGFIDQASVFREQEIDGKSLLLMKRNDVLTGLSLKLGPALKIYYHVQRLQTRGQIMH